MDVRNSAASIGCAGIGWRIGIAGRFQRRVAGWLSSGIGPCVCSHLGARVSYRLGAGIGSGVSSGFGPCIGSRVARGVARALTSA